MKEPTERAQPATCENTDRELWRERAGDFYAPSIHVTAHGGIGINVGGSVYVKPLAEWHRLAIQGEQLRRPEAPAETAAEQSLQQQLRTVLSVALASLSPAARRVAHRWKEIIDAARGVQPATKDERTMGERIREAHQKAKGSKLRFGPAAKQKSARAAEPTRKASILAKLSEKDARCLRDFIGADKPCGPSEITLSFGAGHSGYGLYVWLTDYPEEGTLYFAASLTRAGGQE